jgi:hypothetical protein
MEPISLPIRVLHTRSSSLVVKLLPIVGACSLGMWDDEHSLFLMTIPHSHLPLRVVYRVYVPFC